MTSASQQPIDAQHVLNQQLICLSKDFSYDQEVFPHFAPVKVPDLRNFVDQESAKLFMARLQSYYTLSKVFESYRAENISESQQRMLMDALKRDLGPSLTPSAGQMATPASTPAMNLLNDYLYEKSLQFTAVKLVILRIASFISPEGQNTNRYQNLPFSLVCSARTAVEALVHIMRGELGVQFTRQSIGQVIRLLTNIIFYSASKRLVLLSMWVFSLWNFDPITVPMTTRTEETIERSEESTLNRLGWPSFMSWTIWKEWHADGIDDRVASGDEVDLVTYAGADATIMLASSLDVVTKGKTTSRLVSLVDAISFTLLNQQRHDSSSLRYEALSALMRLVRKIPEPMMALQARWMHALYPSLFDPKLALNTNGTSGMNGNDIAHSTLIESVSYLRNQQVLPHISTSQILLRALNPSSASKPASSSQNPSLDMPFALWTPLSTAFTSTDINMVFRAIHLWGPLLVLLGDEFLKLNMLNVLLKLLQATFTHPEAQVRVASFGAWKSLNIAFLQSKSGIRMVKRLKLILLPILRAFSTEDSLSVLHAALDAYMDLLVALKRYMTQDWPVVLVQPLQLLLKNPLSIVPFPSASSSSITPNSGSSAKTSSNSSSLPPADNPHQLSALNKYILLLVSILRDEDPSKTRTSFNPLELLKFFPHTNDLDYKHSSSNPAWGWDIKVSEIELHLHRKMKGLGNNRPNSPLGIPSPSPSNPAYTQSFLSLIVSMIMFLVDSTASRSRDDQEAQKAKRIEIALARALWSGLCLNLGREHHQHHISLSTSTEKSSKPEEATTAISSIPSGYASNQVKPSMNTKDTKQASNTTKSNEAHSMDALVDGVMVDPQGVLAWSLLQLHLHPIGSNALSANDAWSSFLNEAVRFVTIMHPTLAHDPSKSHKISSQQNSSASSTFGRLWQLITSPMLIDYSHTMSETAPLKDTVMVKLHDTSFVWPPQDAQTNFASSDLMAQTLDRTRYLGQDQLRTSREFDASEIGSKISAVLVELISEFSFSIPSSGALSIVFGILKETRPTFTLSKIVNLSQDVLASQDSSSSSSELILALLRLELPFTCWNKLATSLDNDIKNTAYIYPHQAHLYQTRSEISTSPTKSKSSTNGSSIELPDCDQSMFKNQTLPSLQSMMITSPARSAPSSKSDTTSRSNSAITGASSDSEHIFVTETKHPRLLLSQLISCFIFPLQQAKQILSTVAQFSADSHPGSYPIVSSLSKILSKDMFDRTRQIFLDLITTVTRITQNRFVDTPNRHSEPFSGSLMSLTAVMNLMMIQLLHQLRDASTYERIEHSSDKSSSKMVRVSQSSSMGTSSSNGSLSPLDTISDSLRLRYLWFWQELFGIFTERLVTGRICKNQSLIDDVWPCLPHIISHHTNDLSSIHLQDNFKKILELTDTLTSPISARESGSQTKQRSQPSHKSANGSTKTTTSISPFLEVDMNTLFELATPDLENLLWDRIHFSTFLFMQAPNKELVDREESISQWSKFISRVIYSLGMSWRAAIRLAKGLSINSDKSEYFAPCSSLLESIVSSGLCIVEKWQHGNNLLIDLLPPMSWALASDASAMKLASRSTSALAPILKKPLEKLAGATIACVSRCFADLLGNQAALRDGLSTIHSTVSLQALLDRSASLLQVMFDSKRSSIRTVAWTSWSHTFGRVKGLNPLGDPDFSQTILQAYRDHPEDVKLVEAATWTKILSPDRYGAVADDKEVETKQSSPNGNNGRGVAGGHGHTTKMDVNDAVAVGSGGDSDGGTAEPTISTPSSLYPSELQHQPLRAPYGDSIEQTPPTDPSESATDLFFPVKPVPSAGDTSEAIKRPVDSRVRAVNTSTSFVPQRTPVTFGSTIATNTTTTTTIYGYTTEEEEDEESTVLISPQRRGPLPMSSTGPISFSEWLRLLQSLNDTSGIAMDDPTLGTKQLVAAQQEILKLMTSVTQRVARG